MTFEGKVVAVTGAGGGIGTAIVSKFVDLGAKAVLLDVKEEFAKRTADLLHLTEENSMCLGVDVSKEEDVKEAVSKIRTRFNRVDVLVNTAGIPGPSARTEDYSFEDIKKVYEVNVFGTFLMMQNILPIMQEQKSGAIINMTKNAANENGFNGVRINAVSPGWVDTNMMKTVVDSYKDVGIENSSDNVTIGPMRRVAAPEELANVVTFLASEEASYVNGANFLVDGGMTLG